MTSWPGSSAIELRETSQVGLGALVEGRPLSQGLAELIGYLSLSDPAFSVVFDEGSREEVDWESGGQRRSADGPAVTFTRRASTFADRNQRGER